MKSASIIFQSATGDFNEHKFNVNNEQEMNDYYASWMNHPSTAGIRGCICDWTDSPVLDYYR